MQDASLIGITLAGRFRVTGVIGEGGMATVYRAQQDAEPHDVAIKVMNPDLAKDTRFVRRFRREAKAASMLKHPNTVSILEFGVDQGYVFLAMECLEGHDLALLLHRERRITEVRAVHILIQVCKALSAAHELSIVHRDLKPDNIMLVKLPKGVEPSLPGMAPSDFVKVLDFGIAKILDEDDTKGSSGADPRAEPITSAKSMLTRVGTIVGTPAYMAPEQGRAEPVDGRTDVYACGVLLYELLTGRVPFSGETPMQVVMRHVNETPDPPSKFIPVEPSLERVILKSLAKYPAERQQSAANLAAELTAVLPRMSGEKRQPGDTSAPSSVIIGAAAAGSAPRIAAALPPPPPASGAMAPPPVAPTGMASSGGSASTAAQAAVRAQPSGGKPPPNPLDGSTLVMEPAPPKAPSPPQAPKSAAASAPNTNPQKPLTSGAPAFPTLNIDVPADVMADIDAKLAAGSASAAAAIAPPPTVQKPLAIAPAKFPPARPIDNAVDSDDDVRTLIHDAPATRQSLPNIPAPFSEDDPRTMLAPARGPSIPDLSQPLGALPGAAPDKSTTLVSAAPGEGASAASVGVPAPSTLKALKGTAKNDPVDIQVGVSVANPTTQPSQGVAGLEATQAMSTSQTMSSGGSAKAPPQPKPADPAPQPAVSREVLPLAVATPAAVDPGPAAPEPPALAVWQPKRRRLTGPVAMMLGILIGALLFAIVFAALFLIKPQ